MGMRATFGYIADDRTMKLTSVQWSTMIDRAIGVCAHNARENGDSPVHAVHQMFKGITDQYEHISSLDVPSASGAPVTSPDVELNNGLVLSRGLERENLHDGIYYPQKGWTLRALKDTAYGFHLDGGSLGVVLNEREISSGKVELFYYEEGTENVKVSSLSIEALANFYGDGTGNTLKPFGFRDRV